SRSTTYRPASAMVSWLLASMAIRLSGEGFRKSYSRFNCSDSLRGARRRRCGQCGGSIREPPDDVRVARRDVEAVRRKARETQRQLERDGVCRHSLAGVSGRRPRDFARREKSIVLATAHSKKRQRSGRGFGRQCAKQATRTNECADQGRSFGSVG